MIDTHWDVFAELFVKHRKHINGSLFCPLIYNYVFICDRTVSLRPLLLNLRWDLRDTKSQDSNC